jgi:hypothetical protein
LSKFTDSKLSKLKVSKLKAEQSFYDAHQIDNLPDARDRIVTTMSQSKTEIDWQTEARKWALRFWIAMTV